ncbi:MAG: DMT family transporter [Bacteroidales bacterium]|nr:DMT family transporter [Bacteroidales bacterium]
MEHRLVISHLKLHIIVFIYGFTAIFGKLISLDAVHLVWHRVLIATVALGVFIGFKKLKFALSQKDRLKIASVGLVVALHWISFFGAIKLANVSVALGCLASGTLFTGILEPFFFNKKHSKAELFIGLIIIAGIYLIFRFETHYWQGIAVALISAFLAGLFAVLNKKLVVLYPARIIGFYEMLGAFTGISIYLFISGTFKIKYLLPGFSDSVYLLLLGTVCTAFAFVVQVDVMKKLTAYVVSLAINLEPVYGIVLAYLLFGEGELMSGGFYLGTIIILLSVFGYPVFNHVKNRKAENIDNSNATNK